MKFFSKDFLYKKKTEIDNYITDGLVLRLDGIKNTLGGHSSTTVKWYDLSGNNYDFDIEAENLAWEKDGYYINGDSFMSCATSDFNSPQNMTIEIIFTTGDTNNSNIGAMINNRDRNTYNWMINQYGKKVMFHDRLQNNTDDILETNKKYSAVMRFNNYYMNGFVDNVIRINKTSISTYYGNSTYLVIGANNELGTNEKFYGKVHAIRIYNRALTDAEITHNYNIDKQRFDF